MCEDWQQILLTDESWLCAQADYTLKQTISDMYRDILENNYQKITAKR
jgi:hypothetical protein